MTKTMKAQMPRKFYVITLPCDDQGNYAPDTGADRFVVAYKHKGSWRWQACNVFDAEADAEKCMYVEQMTEFYHAIDDAWGEGVKKNHFEEHEDRGNYLC